MTLHDMRPEEEVIAGYELRRDRHSASSRRAAAAARRDAAARLAVFIATAVIAFVVAGRDPSRRATLEVILAGTVVFSILVVRHRRHEAIVRRERALAAECDNGIARLRRDWRNLPTPTSPSIDALAGHAFADDLDVFGPVSLSRVIGSRSAIIGEPVLREWLLSETAPDLDQLRERQAAVAELAPLAEWRESLAVYGMSTGRSRDALERFLDWAEQTDDPIPASILWIAGALALLTVVLAGRFWLNHSAWRSFAFVVVLNIALTRAWAARISRELESISSRGFDGLAMSRMLEHLRTITFVAPLLRDLTDRAEPQHAKAMRVLDAITRCGEARYSPMGHAALQLLTLWDFHVVAALGRWRRAHGKPMRRRLRALGEIEACSALSTLAFENTNWTYPRFSGETTMIEACDMAHPLLPAATRVGNDVTVGPRGTFLLVTGSNMAGKSTLLRTIGLNVVLAQLGAPVCAASMSLPRLRVRTVMHVRDSIASGTSLFLAELLRIRGVVSAAHDSADAPLLYLADEILHGTNADDRRIAICAILTELLECGAIGAMATHLVDLQNEPALSAHAKPVHFTEQYQTTPSGLVMRFDYRLRPGPATTRNALRLLESLGLHDLASGSDAIRREDA